MEFGLISKTFCTCLSEKQLATWRDFLEPTSDFSRIVRQITAYYQLPKLGHGNHLAFLVFASVIIFYARMMQEVKANKNFWPDRFWCLAEKELRLRLANTRYWTMAGPIYERRPWLQFVEITYYAFRVKHFFGVAVTSEAYKFLKDLARVATFSFQCRFKSRVCQV